MTPEHLTRKRILCLLDYGQMIYSKTEIFSYTPNEKKGLLHYLDGLYKVWLDKGDNFEITTCNLNKYMSKSESVNRAHRNSLIPIFIKTKCYRTKTGLRNYTRIISLTDAGKLLMQEIHKRKTAKEVIDDKHIEPGTETKE